MNQLLIVLLALALSAHCASAKCSSSTVKAIQDLRQGQDDSNILDTLNGEYSFVYVYMGRLTIFLQNKCISATYAKTDNGPTIQYKGATTGLKSLGYKDGAIQILGSDGKVERTSYVIFHSDTVLAQYSCSSALIDASFTSIAVLKSALGTPEADADVAKAKDALVAAGINGGLALSPC